MRELVAIGFAFGVVGAFAVGVALGDELLAGARVSRGVLALFGTVVALIGARMAL